MSIVVGQKVVEVRRVLEDLGLVILDEQNGNYRMQCPWPENHAHGDRTGKFWVHVTNGKWTCFRGCQGGGGNLEYLVQLLRKLKPVEAKRWLLSRGGASDYNEIATLINGPADVQEERSQVKPERAFELDLKRQDPTKTSDYILERGFTPKTLHTWGFRYDEAIRAIVIPAYNIGGDKLVGIIRRMVPPLMAGYPKYLYPSAFKKSHHLFGANRHSSNKGETILTEGPLDTIWLHQHGYTNAVALLGVSCSVQQRRLLHKLGSTIILALDNDSGGWDGTAKLIETLKDSFTLRVAILPKDRGDVQECTAEELETTFSHTKYGWEG